MEFIYCDVNNDTYNIISDFDDKVVIDYYGVKILVTIGDVWKRVRFGGNK